MDTAAALGKAPALRCPWFTLLTASSVRRAALEDSVQERAFLGKKATGF